jgi:hypothetical protein
MKYFDPAFFLRWVLINSLHRLDLNYNPPISTPSVAGVIGMDYHIQSIYTILNGQLYLKKAREEKTRVMEF